MLNGGSGCYPITSSPLISPRLWEPRFTISKYGSLQGLSGLQLNRVVYAPRTRQVLDKDLRATPGSSVLLPKLCSSTLGRDLQAWQHGYLVPLAFFDAARVPSGERSRLRM